MTNEQEMVGRNVYLHFDALKRALKRATDMGFRVQENTVSNPGPDLTLPDIVAVSMTSMEVVEKPKDCLDRALERDSQR